jgi:uncharacterized delta-60 repeat protein
MKPRLPPIWCFLCLSWVMAVVCAGSTGLDGSLPLGFRPNEVVRTIRADATGRVLIAGAFTELNGMPCLYAARLNANGTLDPTFELGRGFDTNQSLNVLYGGVRWLAPAADERVYVVGPFAVIEEGTTYRQVFRFHEDGRLDIGFNSGASIEGMLVSTALVLPDHKLMVARRLLADDGSIRASVAVLDEDGNLDPGFDSSLEANQLIHVLMRQPDGRILVAGAFTEIGGKVRDGIARLFANGELDESFDPGTTPEYDPGLRVGQPVLSLALQSDGRILAGGNFSGMGGRSRPHVLRLEPDGRLDEAFGVELLPRFQGGAVRVNAVAVQPEDRIAIGGWFERVNGITSPQAARLFVDGSVDPSFETGAERLHEVRALAVQPDGALLVAGGNPAVIPALGMVLRVGSSGDLDDRFAMTGPTIAGPFEISSVRAIAVQQDGHLILGGRFTSFNRVGATNLVRVGPDGVLDRSFQGAPGGSAVNAIVLDSMGRVLVAGDFPGGVTRLLSDGCADPEFDIGEGIEFAQFEQPWRESWAIRCLAVQSDGRIMVGGAFDRAGGLLRRGLARFNSNGSLDDGFNAQLGLDWGNPVVNSILVQPDGKLIVGGVFGRVGEVPRSAVARLDSNGDLDATFDAQASSSAVVLALALDATGSIVMGGGDMRLAGQNVLVLGRVDASGKLDAAFRPAFASLLMGELLVRSVAIQADGQVLVGGAFASVDGLPRRGLVRLSPAGAVDADFHVGPGLESDPWGNNVRLVWTLALESDGRLLVGGDFIRAGGTGCAGLVRWRTATVQRIRLHLRREASSRLWLGLDGPIPAGTRVEVSSDLVAWEPWHTLLESADGFGWALEAPLETRRFFRAVQDNAAP